MQTLPIVRFFDSEETMQSTLLHKLKEPVLLVEQPAHKYAQGTCQKGLVCWDRATHALVNADNLLGVSFCYRIGRIYLQNLSIDV